MNLQELKLKTPEDLLAFADELDIEAAGTLRQQDLMFSILKRLAASSTRSLASGAFDASSQDQFGSVTCGGGNMSLLSPPPARSRTRTSNAATA